MTQQQRQTRDCESWNKRHNHGERSSTYVLRCTYDGPYLRCRIKEPARLEQLMRDLWHIVVAVELIDDFLPEDMNADNIPVDYLVSEYSFQKVWNPDNDDSDW